MNGLFHISARPVVEEIKGERRSFTGDGTAILQVPGLRSIELVRVGNFTLPEFTKIKYPATGQVNVIVEQDLPTYGIGRDEDDNTILMRATFSNDGIWQKDATISVVGEWDPVEETEVTAAPSETPADPKTPAK